jgi:hypothetical protein
MSIDEGHIEGWENIAKFFTMIGVDTVRKKYGKEMFAGG